MTRITTPVHTNLLIALWNEDHTLNMLATSDRTEPFLDCSCKETGMSGVTPFDERENRSTPENDRSREGASLERR